MSTMGGLGAPDMRREQAAPQKMGLASLPDDVREMVAGALINTFRQDGALGASADAAQRMVELERLAAKADIPDDDPEARDAFVQLAGRMLELGIITQEQLDQNIALAMKSRP